MPIRFEYRKGSLSLELVLVLPVVLMVMLTAGYVLEAMVFRHDLAFAVRNNAAQAAAENSCTAPVADRSGIQRTATITCQQVDDERGLRQERPIFSALSQAANRYWPGFLRDVDPGRPVWSHIANGQGGFRVSSVDFLSGQFGVTESHYTHRRPDGMVWTHYEAPWRAAYDPVAWQRLSRRGTARLFPNVFPAR